MTTKRRRGANEGTIDARGEGAWRPRYHHGGRRHTVTVRGSLADAKQELRRRLHSGDIGTHTAPAPTTLAQWCEEWLQLMGPKVRAGTLQRYTYIINNQIVPALGHLKLQAITTTEIDNFYRGLAKDLAPQTVHLTSVVLNSCLKTARRKKRIAYNPCDDADKPKTKDDEGAGKALTGEELGRLVKGFEGHTLYVLVCLCAFVGLRRGEVLGLMWTDLNVTTKELHIQRSLEHTAAHGLRLKPPKTKRGNRKITIGDDVIAVLLELRQKHLQIAAGVGDAEVAGVDLGLVRLPPDALVFPAPTSPFSFIKLRTPETVSTMFTQHAAKLGFEGLRLHDLRHSLATRLLDDRVPLHTVAHRLGHSARVLLQIYAHATKEGDAAAAAATGEISKSIIGSRS